MGSYLTALAQWYDQRILRERIILLLGVVALLAAGVYLLVLEPAAKQRAATQQQIARMNAEIAQLEQMVFQIRSRPQSDPDQQSRERRDLLEQLIAEQRQQLHLGLSHLVAPEEMPGLLRQIVSRSDLELVRLENQTPQLIQTDGPQGDAAPRLYRHQLEMDLRGDYLSLLSYLRQLEQLPRLLVWDEIDVVTREYPATTIRLRVYTLGLTENWLGG